VLNFRGRLKRFVKLGGEMISLPAVETVLEKHFLAEDQAEEGPVLAVQATADEEHPELVLFTTVAADREIVNRVICKAGLSGLHNIRRVIPMDKIPILGTGKTDYRELARRLAAESSQG
jgi:long-chain-fatty-acid--[acyl-carrier-protein] ligase